MMIAISAISVRFNWQGIVTGPGGRLIARPAMLLSP
jgi:hypothetical protein